MKRERGQTSMTSYIRTNNSRKNRFIKNSNFTPKNGENLKRLFTRGKRQTQLMPSVLKKREGESSC